MDKRAIDMDELIREFENLSLNDSNRVTRTTVSSAAVASASAPAPSLAAVATASASTSDSLANKINRLKSAVYATSNLSPSSIDSSGASTSTSERLTTGSWASMIHHVYKNLNRFMLAQNGAAYFISSLGNIPGYLLYIFIWVFLSN